MHSSNAPVKTALVTGSEGFTGRYVKPALRARGFQVSRLDAVGPNPCDLTDAEAVERRIRESKPEVVVHLAGVAFVAHGNFEDFYRVNVLGTLNLLQALAKLDHPPSRVMIVSSGNVYGTPAEEVVDESICPAPVNHYSNSKLAAEHMARTWFDRLPILIVRPFNYTGPGQASHFLIPKIVSHFRQRASIIELGNLDVTRDFSDVEDVVDAYMALLESGVRSEVVNVCSGCPLALLDIVEMMSEIAGYKIEVRVNPQFVRKNEVPRLIGCPAKLKRLVNLKPPRPFAETLRRMYEAPRIADR